MNLKNQISLCSGKDFWHTKEFPKENISSFCMSDGPAGLRKQVNQSDMLGVNESVPATCFPAETNIACGWNRKTAACIGASIAEEAKLNGVQMVLGPGANIKRNPLCGRNFEYFSEDPILSGTMAESYISGMQNAGVASCIKHFACNSQEYMRFTSDSLVDEKTLRELYLVPFEIAVRRAKPKAVMSAYNKLNGEYCSSNKKLLTDILRGEWNFDGIVITDWGAMVDRTQSFLAGCDLAMPGGSAFGEKHALRLAKKDEQLLRCIKESAERIAKLSHELCQSKNQKEIPLAEEVYKKNYQTALNAAEESFVLLKNKNQTLPLQKENTVIIGAMAQNLRIQGSGSSHINFRHKTELVQFFPQSEFAVGYNDDGSTEEALVREAVELSLKAKKENKTVLLVAGLPKSYESEGFDRKDMSLPQGMNELIKKVCEINEKTVVVIAGGGAVELPWKEKAAAILYAGLPGEAGAEALFNVLTGKVSPSGKLAESWPLSYADVANAKRYSEKNPDGKASYEEKLFNGYRHYTSRNIPVCYSFGHGLTYTTFSYSDIFCDKKTVSCKIKNEGSVSAKEVVQLYVSLAKENSPDEPRLLLKDFEKIHLAPGEEKTVSFTLTDETFRVWKDDSWHVAGGTHTLHIGSSCTDLRLCTNISLEEKTFAKPRTQDGTCPTKNQKRFTMENTINQLRPHSAVMRLMYRMINLIMTKKFLGKNSSPQTYRMMMTSSVDNTFAGIKQSSGLKFPVFEFLLWLSNCGL